MDYKIFWATFTTVFIAELGDKTQFVALAASAQTKSTLSVLLGIILGLALAGTIGVLCGRLLGTFISPEKLKYAAGPLFIVMGLWIIFK